MKKHDQEHVRISLYVNRELYEEFIANVTVVGDTASATFERKMREWLIVNRDYVLEKLEERRQRELTRGMS